MRHSVEPAVRRDKAVGLEPPQSREERRSHAPGKRDRLRVSIDENEQSRLGHTGE
jgi:hypothetical protein